MELPLAVRLADAAAGVADGALIVSSGLLLVGVRPRAVRLLEAGLAFGLVVVGVTETYRRLGLPLGGHNVVLVALYPLVLRLLLGVRPAVGLAAGLLAMSLMWLGNLIMVGLTAALQVDMAGVLRSWPAYLGLWLLSMLPLGLVGVGAWRRRLVLVDLREGVPVRGQTLFLLNVFLAQTYGLLLLAIIAATRRLHFWQVLPTGLPGYFVWLLVLALPVAALAAVGELHRLLELEGKARKAGELQRTVQIAGMLVHEVGNPLQNVFSRLQMLRYALGGVPGDEDGGGGGEAALAVAEQSAALGPEGLRGERLERARRHLAEALRTVRLLTGMMHDFLLLARTSEERVAVDLPSVVKEVLEECRPAAEERGVRLTAAGAEGVPPIEGRRRRIEQLVRNLVLNAMQSCVDGGEVIVTVNQLDRSILLEVSDTGCGIPAHLRERIFDPFFTTKEMGTGLGLAVVRQVAEEHGASIEVRDREGRGTVFVITFPLACDHASAA